MEDEPDILEDDLVVPFPTTPDRSTRNPIRLQEVQRTPVRDPPPLRLEAPLIEPVMRRELSVQIHPQGHYQYILQLTDVLAGITEVLDDIDLHHPA